ncbi:ribosomal protein L7/L12 [Treponema socranskii subsp. buccale]|uniref:ribosomal protein L7/L12 n=1 Tax=Treponema socranskii TaxID=53419 RepID=UPI0020A522B1|nr:ribosomal protein L7/L12 [Treponema socranskii]UTD01662.1 ribosomal protein L7/L12 [Treponema socranskii subsp. buccale]
MRTCLRKIGILAAAILFAASVSLALLFTACSNNAGGNTGGGTPAAVSYRIIFRVDGGHGTLKAKAEGVAETATSPISVEKDKTVTFIAAPESGYRVEKWTVTPESALIAEGKAGNTLAKVKITANTKVNVNFTNDLYTVTLENIDPTKKEAVIKAVSEITGSTLEEAKTLVESAPKVLKENITEAEADEIIAKIAKAGGTASRPERYTVALTPGEHGTVTANPVIPASGKVDKDTEITFTAVSESGYKVDTWTITPASALQEGGTAGSSTAKVKITAATTVNVSFTKEGYAVTFDAKGGTPVPAAQTVKYKEKASVPSPEPTKEGHTFEGWYNKDGDSLWDFAVNEVTQNTELYAKWRINTYPVTFNATPPNGTLKAEIAGTAIASGKPIEYGKTVTFTADPATGYKVDKWTITPASALQEGGTAGSQTAKVKITADTNVNVSFTLKTYPVTFSVDGGHGTLKAELAGSAIASGQPVEYGKTVTFTAGPASGYKVDTWTITGGTFEEGGTPGSTTAKVKITADINVNVTFTSLYEPVAFGTNGTGLDTYLKNTAPHTDGICYIKVTGLTPADLKGGSSYPIKPSALGKILKDNPTKKVALKLEEIPGLTDMTACFLNCTNLIQAPVIQSSVTNMTRCFEGCTGLTQAPVIPGSVIIMAACFGGCTSLTQAPVLPNGVTDIRGCFSGCYRLTQAPVIPESVTYMTNCFGGCTSLTQAPVIPSSVTDMQSCFKSCTSLRQAPVIPSSVTNMSKCFFDCENLYYAPVFAASASVTDMTSCFESCYRLTQAPVLPNGVTNMENCFSHCTSLTQAPVIPSSVTNMESCFFGCTSLTQAPDIPSSVTNMTRCFEGCEKLYHAPVFAASASVTDMKCCFQDCKRLVSAPKIPNGVTNMFGCFSDCKSLTRAPVIPNGVTDMRFCFSGCWNLTLPPTIPNSVTRMFGCFEGCESLTYANEIPSSVTNMTRCFRDCKNLTFVTLKCDYVADNFNEAFSGCTKLTAGSIKVPADQLQTYRNNATIMGALKDRFIAE